MQEHQLPVTLRCALLDVSRSSAYYQSVPVSERDAVLMRAMDAIHLRLPFCGSRRMEEIEAHRARCTQCNAGIPQTLGFKCNALPAGYSGAGTVRFQDHSPTARGCSR